MIRSGLVVMSNAAEVGPIGRAFAWLGGALFVVALFTGGRWFVVTLAHPAETAVPLPAALAWNVALFSLFALHHSVLARTRAKTWITRAVPPALERSVYVWLASLLFLAVCVLWQRVPGVLYTASGAVRGFLMAIQVAGVGLTIAGARVLDGLELAGVRQAIGRLRPSDIRVVWPFTLVRHPIYLGWLLMVGAASPMTLDRAVFAAVSVLYLVIAMPWEERSLVAAAGPAYQAYCRRVRWRLVPGLY